MRATNRGVTMVEFTLGLPVFLLLVFAVIEIALLAYSASVMQYTATRTARFAAIGRAYQDPDTGTNYFDIQAAKKYAVSEAASFGVTLDETNIQVCSLSGVCDFLPGAGSYLRLVVNRQENVFWFLGTMDVSRSAIARRERNV